MLLAALLIAAPSARGALPPTASGEQKPQMFASPAWQSLQLRASALPRSVGLGTGPGRRPRSLAFMAAARAHRQDVLVTFTAHRGCYVAPPLLAQPRLPRAGRRGPTARRSAGSTTGSPWVRTYSAWNEVNHISQPTFRQPAARRPLLPRCCAARAAGAASASWPPTCSTPRTCARYVRSFLRQRPGAPAAVGTAQLPGRQPPHVGGHARRCSASSRAAVWLTETGGVVKFGNSRQFRYSESRAARRTRWMFRLAGRYDTRRRGLRSSDHAALRLPAGSAQPPGAHFDAGLVSPDGTPRRAYSVVAEHARSHR